MIGTTFLSYNLGIGKRSSMKVVAQARRVHACSLSGVNNHRRGWASSSSLEKYLIPLVVT